MIYPFNRGIYEHLWSEHKYCLIAISHTKYQDTAAKLGKTPQIFAFLKRIAQASNEAWSDCYNALLYAYMHLKPKLSRTESFEIVQTLLSHLETASSSSNNDSSLDKINQISEKIFDAVLKYQESSLFGCRLFYPYTSAYKLWDTKQKLGLWLCFGSFQSHLTIDEVVWRIGQKTNLSFKEILELLKQLQNKVLTTDFEQWDPILVSSLYSDNLIATTPTYVVLHPGLNISQIVPKQGFDELCEEKIAALIIESIWNRQLKHSDILFEISEKDYFSEYQKLLGLYQKDFKNSDYQNLRAVYRRFFAA